MIRVGMSQLARAHNRRCAICGREFSDLVVSTSMPDAGKKTREHVWPRALYPDLKHKGNLVITHRHCNMRRGTKKPTDKLLRILGEVNTALGWELSIDQRKFDGSRPVPTGAVLLLDVPA